MLRLCHAAKVPVVARGAGTGLSGGAMPHKRGVVLSLAKFKRILAIDPMTRTAVVQPGVRNLAISEAADAYGLYYAPDPSSQIACSIGGNVAENAGGVHCLKYGLTVHNVRRVRAVTIEGEVVEFGGDALDSAGLRPARADPRQRRPARRDHRDHRQAAAEAAGGAGGARRVRDVEAAGEAVADVIAAGIVPAGLEMMDQAATRAVEQFVHANYPLDAAAILLVESDGSTEEVAAEMAEIRRVLIECRRDRRSVSRKTRSSASCSGRDARRRSPRQAASRPTTTASTARFRARRCARVLRQIGDVVARVRPAGRERVPCRRRQPAPADPLRRATGRATPRRRSRSATASSSFASRSAARSPASTAWASRSSTACACSSRARRSSASTASRQRSIRTACSTRARPCPRLRAAPSSARCTCTTARSPHPDLPRF